MSLLAEAKYVISQRGKWLSKIDNGKYSCQMEIIDDLFHAFPKNNDYKIVYHKASILNLYASTVIFNIQPTVNKIIKLNIDNELQQGKQSLVLQIAKTSKQLRNNISFASKYCALHNHKAYLIYDSYVREYLARVIVNGKLRKFSGGTLTQWRDNKLKQYTCYTKVYKTFIEQYNLSSLTYNEVDQYIWTACVCKKHNLNVVQKLNLFKLI